MRGGDYEEFTDRLYPIAKYAAWVGGFLGLILTGYFFLVSERAIFFKNPRAYRLLLLSPLFALLSWLTIAGFGFLFAPRAVFESYKGQELMGKFGTSSVFLARLAIFIHLLLGLGAILGIGYRVFFS